MMAVGCLFPSFDGLDEGSKGRSRDGEGTRDKAPGTSLPSSPLSSDAGPSGQASIVDAASVSARAATVLCRSERCALGTEVCCGGVVSIDCEPAANAGKCMTGFLRCSDNENCSGGQTCCFDSAATSELSSCQTKCEGQSKLVACDPSIDPPHCPTGMKCTGLWGRGLPFCEQQ